MDWQKGRDATEVMDTVHTQNGRSMYFNLPKSKPNYVALLQRDVAPDNNAQINMGKLHDHLEAHGWWKRD